ncbi:MAG: triphosphoribosyl-dephospho-CoA synthase CitG [Oscillospiraceae bacterium]|nr:triphosphoribosyl-dephospho-CoA synthase CitG [Oscillospiraceae bacterium]
MTEREITLSEILTAREERVAIQNVLLSEYKTPVISFTMNIAGPVKVTALSHRAFLWGMDQLRLGFLQNKMQVRKEFSRHLPTGDEGYFAIDAPADRVKALCVEIEETNSMGRMGRLFDMDVIGLDGKKLERGTERPCIVCGKPGRDCASRRLHSVAELQLHTAALLRSGLWFAAQNRIAVLATRALLDEVAVTPKPGLVDRANNGAHRDMDLFSFQASAAALENYWRVCVGIGQFDRDIVPNTLQRPVPSSETFAKLRPLGKQAERDMLAATGGVNTHKGAIFTLGVLCGAIGRLWTAENGFPEPEAILDEAAAMTRETLEQELPAAHWNTAGEALFQKYGARGIRGQVADGLPAVREISLPVFQKLLAEGLDRNHAAAVTLLHLIAHVEDTNLLHRGGPEGAAWAKEKAAELLSSGAPSLEEIAELDRQFIRRNLSPGGCADLLAVTLFLESLHS